MMSYSPCRQGCLDGLVWLGPPEVPATFGEPPISEGRPEDPSDIGRSAGITHSPALRPDAVLRRKDRGDAGCGISGCRRLSK